MESPPKKREGRLPAAFSQMKPQQPSRECQLLCAIAQLLCGISRDVISLGDKLDDCVIVNQQAADLLRRILGERAP